MTYSGALKLGQIIADYWLRRGHIVDIIIEEARSSHRATIWCVRSKMVNGHPQRPTKKS